MTTARRTGWMLAVLTLASVGCSLGGPSAGGQSGTDDDSSTVCARGASEIVAFDQVTPFGSAAQLRERIERVLADNTEIPLRWTPELGGTTTLAIEAREWGSQATLRTGQCSQLSVSATLRLTSADGLLDETLEGEFSDRLPLSHDENVHWQGRTDTAPEYKGALFEASFEANDPSFATIVGMFGAATTTGDGGASRELSSLATFDSRWPRGVSIDDVYGHPPAFQELCSGAQLTEPGFQAFGSDDALVDALAGDWVLCSSTSTGAPAHAGLSIQAGGTWTHLAERGGTLIEQLGFGHEGTFEVIDTSEINGRNARQLNLAHMPQDYGLSRDRSTLSLLQSSGPFVYDNVYVRADVPIGPPLVVRARNERAGVSACEEGEAYVHGFASVDELRTSLVGAWAICSGGYRDGAVGISFAADGSYRHLDAAGGTIATGLYELLDNASGNGGGATQVNMTDDDAPADRLTKVYVMGFPLQSDAPIKLLSYGETHDTLLSALP